MTYHDIYCLIVLTSVLEPPFGSPPSQPASPTVVDQGPSQTTSTNIDTGAWETSQAVLEPPNLSANDGWGGWNDWAPGPTAVTPPPAVQETATPPLTAPPQDSIQPADTEGAPPQNPANPPPAVAGDSPPPQENGDEQANSEQREGGEDNESQDDDSSDEEERAYWADFVEDTSGPDERELKMIEEDGQETDALNREC